VTGISATETRKFVYLAGSFIRELDNDTPPNVVKECVRGLDLGGGIGGIIYQRMIPEEGRDKYYYYHYNHKGDVVALTDGDGKPAAYYEYDAWGNTMTEAEVSGVDNPYRYLTKEWDEKSGLYYFGFRYYSPEIGRWTQRDPAGTVDGLNLYIYVRNAPVHIVDPVGAWGRDVHYGLTKDWARMVGICEEAAEIIASGNQGVDDDPRTSSIIGQRGRHIWGPDDWEPGLPREAQVDPRLEWFTLEMSEGYPGCAGGQYRQGLEALGRALHSLQDYYAHGPYKHPFGRNPKNKLMANAPHPAWYDDWCDARSQRERNLTEWQSIQWLSHFMSTSKCIKCICGGGS